MLKYPYYTLKLSINSPNPSLFKFFRLPLIKVLNPIALL